jgi:hypothetical protein
MDTFVLPVRKGGLGNQMFQVAAGLIYATETKRRVVLPNEFYNSHRTLQADYSESIFREFIYRLDKAIDQPAIDALVRSGFSLYPGEPGFEVWRPLDLSGNVILHGYFQSYPPIQPHEDTIRRAYLSCLGNYRIHLQESRKRIGLHVRRGDYLQPPHTTVLPTQPLSYYEEALRHFSLPHYEVYIFSDDIPWCKEQALFQSLPQKVFVEEPNEVKTLALMTTCHGGFICANSTFSWWGAFLGAYADRQPVFVPKHWVNGQDTSALFPSEWIQL